MVTGWYAGVHSSSKLAFMAARTRTPRLGWQEVLSDLSAVRTSTALPCCHAQHTLHTLMPVQQADAKQLLCAVKGGYTAC